MKELKKVQAMTFFVRRFSRDSQENKILCTGCRREMNAWELHYDAAIEGLLCRICSCAHTIFEQQQIEMED